MRPDPETCELMLTALQPGVSLDDAVAAAGWALRVADHVETLTPPDGDELAALRALQATVAAPSGHAA